MAEIEFRRVTKRYGSGNPVVAAVELSIASRELLVILGPSGSGKTTLLRLLAGLESPDSGGVWMDGRDVTRVAPHRRDVAMVFQNPALYPHLSVFDNIAFGLRARSVPRSQVRARVNTMAGLLGLDALLTRRPAELSGVNASAWRSAARSYASLGSCSATSRSRASTLRSAPPSARRSPSCTAASTRPWYSSPTTRTRLCC